MSDRCEATIHSDYGGLNYRCELPIAHSGTHQIILTDDWVRRDGTFVETVIAWSQE